MSAKPVILKRADWAWHASLVEGDVAPVNVASGIISTAIDANEIRTYRFGTGSDPRLIFADGFESGDPSAWSSVSP